MIRPQTRLTPYLLTRIEVAIADGRRLSGAERVAILLFGNGTADVVASSPEPEIAPPPSIAAAGAPCIEQRCGCWEVSTLGTVGDEDCPLHLDHPRGFTIHDPFDQPFGLLCLDVDFATASLPRFSLAARWIRDRIECDLRVHHLEDLAVSAIRRQRNHLRHRSRTLTQCESCSRIRNDKGRFEDPSRHLQAIWGFEVRRVVCPSCQDED